MKNFRHIWIRVKGLSVLTLSQLVASLIGVISNIFMIHLLGVELVGLMATFTAAIALVTVLSGCGISYGYLKLSHSNEEEKHFNLLVIHILGAIILSSIGIWFFPVEQFKFIDAAEIRILFVLVSIFSVVISVSTLRCRFYSNYKVLSCIRISQPLLLLLFLILIYELSGHYYINPFIFVNIPVIFTGIIIFLLVYRLPKKNSLLGLMESLKLLFSFSSFLPISILTFAMDAGVFLVLGFLIDAENVGIFAILWKFGLMMSFAIDAQNALYMRSMVIEGSQDIRYFSKLNILLSLPLVIIGSIVFILLGTFVLQVLKEELHNIFIIGFLVMLKAACGPQGLVLIMNGHERSTFILSVLYSATLYGGFLLAYMSNIVSISIVTQITLVWCISTIAMKVFGAYLLKEKLDINIIWIPKK